MATPRPPRTGRKGFGPIIAELERLLGGGRREAPPIERPAPNHPRRPRRERAARPCSWPGLAAMLVVGMIGAYFVFKPAPAPKAVELAKTIFDAHR